jgi:hypothetical protein
VRFLIVLALADISLRLVELPVRSGAVESWFRGMKYRTKKVRIRQKLSVAVGIVALVAATTVISANAISVADQEAAAFEKELTQEINGYVEMFNSVCKQIGSHLLSKFPKNRNIHIYNDVVQDVIKKKPAEPISIFVVNVWANDDYKDSILASNEKFFRGLFIPYSIIISRSTMGIYGIICL